MGDGDCVQRSPDANISKDTGGKGKWGPAILVGPFPRAKRAGEHCEGRAASSPHPQQEPPSRDAQGPVSVAKLSRLPSPLQKVLVGWASAGLCCRGCTHHPPAAVVVQVHQCPGILHFFLLGIHKGFGKADPIVDVVAAAAPVELPALVLGATPLERVTAADLEVPLAARPRDGVDHPGRGDGVDEGGLPAACHGERNRDGE